MDAFKPVLAKVATGAPLSREETRNAFDLLLSGEVTPAQASGLLMALRVRGETPDELTGAIDAMRNRMLPVQAPADAIDIVGTGGDNHGSYNVSTLAAIITAACGVPVAKHGNRAASSLSGTADVLAELGVQVGIPPQVISTCIREAGIGFMFAPAHHASMRHVAPVRAELGTRTLFNLIGPLSNPASVDRQLVGVFSSHWLEAIANSLAATGSRRVWVVSGSDGLDEMTTTGPTHVAQWDGTQVRRFDVLPEEAGLPRASIADLRGGNPAHNAAALRGVLDGARNPYRDIAVFNAAGALVVAEKAGTLKDGAALAQHALDSGAARAVLDRLVTASNGNGT